MLEIIIGVIVVISIITFIVVMYNNEYEMANVKTADRISAASWPDVSFGFCL